eukprot:XP_019918249.1 PREDICTED: uncharacterized protein LOC105349175 [Crassostrea gigas]
MSGLVTKMYAVFVCVGVFVFANGYVNIALNKQAYQQYQMENDTWDASNAVDGRKSDLSSSGGQCAISYVKQTATWWVNLTTIHSIHHITIFFLTNNKPWGIIHSLRTIDRNADRDVKVNYDVISYEVQTSPSINYLSMFFLGFSVYVSNTTDRLQETLCYKDDNFTLDTKPAVFTTTCAVHGQYVIYYNERLPGVTYPDDYSDGVATGLCEVEVYGECSVKL